MAGLDKVTFFGGGSGSFSIPAKYIFTGADKTACETARDSYFTASPSELKKDVNVVLKPADGSGPYLQQYNGTAWVDISTVIQGPPGKNGNDGKNFAYKSKHENASFSVGTSNYTNYANAITTYSGLSDGVVTLSDATADATVWAESNIYIFRNVSNRLLTINSPAGRLLDDGSSSVSLKKGESLMIQGSTAFGSRVIIKVLDSILGFPDGGTIGPQDNPKTKPTGAYYVTEAFTGAPTLIGSYVGDIIIQDNIDGDNGKLITYYTQEGIYYLQKFSGGWEPWSEPHTATGYVKKPDGAITPDELYSLDVATNKLIPTGVTAKDGSVKTSSGSIAVGDHVITSVGENVGFSNSRTSANYVPPWQEIKETGNEGPLRVNFITELTEVTRSTDVSQDLTNPSWTITSQPNNEALFEIIYTDVVAPITNVTLFGHIGADEVFKVFLGDFTVGENVKKLRYQLFIKDLQQIVITMISPDGDIVIKGSASGIPAYKVKIRDYTETSEAGEINSEIQTINQDISDLQDADQVLQQNIDQKISGIHVEDFHGNAFDDINDIQFEGATLEDHTGQSVKVVIEPLINVSNGPQPGDDDFNVKALEFPGATLSVRDPSGANVGVIDIDTDPTPIIVDGVEITTYQKIEFEEFTQTVTNDVLILTPPDPAANQGITLDNDTANIAGVTTMKVKNATLTNKGGGVVQVEHNIQWEDFEATNSIKKWGLEVGPDLEVSESPTKPDFARLLIKPGSFESRHSTSYYASLSDDVEVAGLVNGQVRTGVLWFDNVIKPAGTFIEIDRDNKAIGLQEDDLLDPNVTGGTPYFIYTRVSMKGNAEADGYVQLFLRDLISKEFVVDSKGEPLAVRKTYKAGDKLGALDIATIKKFTGIEQFQICVDENFGQNDPIVIEDRTEGNSCVLVQAIDSSDQTGRGLLQCENDLGKNFEWAGHYIGDKFVSLGYYLKEDVPLTTITSGTGQLSADGWNLNNFTEMKVGIANDKLTLQDDGVNFLGFSFGNVISAEKTQILRNENVNAYITTSTPQNAGRVYAAKWTGVPDQYTQQIITGIDPSGEPVMGVNWVLLGVSIFCTEDVTGNQNTYSGAFTVPDDSENFAIFFAPEELQNPGLFEITEFYFDKDPAISGFFLHAPEESGERHLIEGTKYARVGLNTEGYASLRYTINQADTPMPSGKIVKGKADIEANWAGTGAAVDFITLNQPGDFELSTSYRVYPGESIPPAGTADVVFWWAQEQGAGNWVLLPETEVTHTMTEGDPVTIVTTPDYTFKGKPGDKLRAFATSEIDDGAYIQSTSPQDYLCDTTINFKEFVPGSEDEPVLSIYVQDELGNDWELTAGTDGHLETLLVGDLPENTDHHVLRSNFSGNDFVVGASGEISLVQKTNPYMSAHMSINMVYDTALEEKIILFDTVDGSSGIALPATGEFSSDVNGMYYGVITLQVKEGSDPTFLTWLEIKPDGGVWGLAPMEAMTINKMKTDTNFSYIITGMFPINEGDTMRVNAMSKNPSPDKVEIKEVTQAVSLGTVTQRSARISIFRVSDLPV